MILALFVASLAFDKQQLTISIKDAFQQIMAINPGISSTSNLYDMGTGESTELSPPKKLFHLIKAIPEAIKYKLRLTPEIPRFKRLDLDIKFVNYRTLMNDRERAIREGILSNPTTVKGHVRLWGKPYRAKIRLKGDRQPHWISRHRISFRVNIRGKNTILGFKKFSLQKPETRAHPYDQTFQEMMRKAGNLSSVQTYVRVFVNGSDWGVMNMEEHVDKVFLEKLQRKESAIIRFKDERVWLYRMNSVDPYRGYRLSDPILNIHLYGANRYLTERNVFRKWLTYISEARMKPNHSYLYDVDSFSRAMILTRAWGEHHTLGYANTRYYLNPYTIRLEPITTDQLPYKVMLDNTEEFIEEKLDLQYLQVMATDAYKNNLRKNTADVNEVVLGIQEVLDEYQSYFPLDQPKNGQIVIDNMQKVNADPERYLLNINAWTEKKNEEFNLPTNEQAAEFDVHLYVRHYEDGRLEFYNLLPDAVQVKRVLYNGEPVIKKPLTVPGYKNDTYAPVTLHTDYTGLRDWEFNVETEYKGNVRQVTNEITLLVNGMSNPLLVDTPRNLKFLKELPEGNWEIPKGKWFVDGPLTVNGDLNIVPGTHLKFSEDSYLIVKGNLTAEANWDQPIVLGPAKTSWKGLYVLEGKQKSRLRNVIIRDTSALQDGLLELTGGVTFYNTQVDLNEVRFEETQAEDALNIVKSSFTITDVEIVNAVSDGIDFDFSTGTVMASKFKNIGGDALDFSGSKVDIKQVVARKIKDKAVSVGEASSVNITESDFKDVGVGIASKDGSDAKAENVIISDYAMHAAMTYTKKDFYDTPSLTLINCVIDNRNPYSRQVGTKMRVDKVEVAEVQTNVTELYLSEIMKK